MRWLALLMLVFLAGGCSSANEDSSDDVRGPGDSEFATISRGLHYCEAPDETQREWKVDYGDLVSTNGTAVDSENGRTVIGGEFEDGLDFPSGPNFSAVKDRDAFIASFHDTGSIDWALHIQSDFDVVVSDVATDHKGDIYAVGYFEEEASVSDTASQTHVMTEVEGGVEIFVMRLTWYGVIEWTRVFGGEFTDRAYGVDTLFEGEGGEEDPHIYVTGEFEDEASFGAHSITAVGGTDAFLTSLSDHGIVLQASGFGGNFTDIGYDAAVDEQMGHVYLTGTYAGSANFGGPSLPVAGGQEVAFAGYDLQLNHAFSHGYGSRGDDEGYGVDATSSEEGRVTITGRFEEEITFGDDTLVAHGVNAFVSTFERNGTHAWSEQVAQSDEDIGWDVAFDDCSRIFVTGTHKSISGGTPIEEYVWLYKFDEHSGGLLSTYDRDGTVLYGTPPVGEKVGNAIGTAPEAPLMVWTAEPSFTNGSFLERRDDHCACTQECQNDEYDWQWQVDDQDGYDVDVAHDNSRNLLKARTLENGDEYVELAKYDENGSLQWSHAFQDSGNQFAPQVAADADDNVYFLVTTEAKIDLGGGPVPSSGIQGDFDVVIAKFDDSGTFQWHAPVTGPGEEYVSLDVDDDGNVYVAGSVLDESDTVVVDGVQVSPSGSNQRGFIVMLDDAGVYQWHEEITGNYDNSVGQRVDVGAARPSGGAVVIATGSGSTGHDFGCSTVPSSFNNEAILIAAYDDSGSCEWIEQFDDDPAFPQGAERPFGAAVLETDDDGDEYTVYVVAQLTQPLSSDSSYWPFGDIAAPGDTSSVVFKMDVDEMGTNPRWATGLGGPGYDQFQDITVTPDENVLAGGFYDGEPDYGDGALPQPPSGETNAALVRLDSMNGDTDWTEAFETSRIQSVDAYDACQVAFAGGGSGNSVDFGGGASSVESFGVSFTP